MGLVMRVVVMVMAMRVMSMMMAIDNDIVVWIAIVGNQCATIIIAGKLNGIDVDLVDRRNDGLTIVLNDDLVSVDGSSGKLWVNVGSNFGVATDQVQLHAVRACLRVFTILRATVRVACMVMSMAMISVAMVGVAVTMTVVGLGFMRVSIMVAVIVVLMSMVVVPVVIVTVMLIVALHNNIIVRVAVIRDKHAAIIIASELNSVGINLVDRHNHGLAIGLNDGRMRRNGSRCELWMSAWCSIYVAADHVKLDSVRAGTWRVFVAMIMVSMVAVSVVVARVTVTILVKRVL